jgi:hypothetical protein
MNDESKGQLIESKNNPIVITGAQDFKDGKSYVSVSFQKIEGAEINTHLYLITSDKQKIQYSKSTLLERGIIVERMPFMPNTTWSEKDLEQFLSGSDTKSIKSIWETIKSLLEGLFDFTDKRWQSVIALWIIGTYFHRQFVVYPYIHLNGNPGSGKTKCLTFIASLAFNGELSVNNTPSYITRVVHNNHATCCIDEVERLHKAKDEDSKTILAILNAGYKRGSYIGKSEQSKKDGLWKPVKFEAYSPKVLAGINNITATLASRCIPIIMLRSNNKTVVNKEVDEDSPIWSSVRNDLYRALLTYPNDINKVYKELVDTELLGRSWELWKPILALAQYISHDLYAEIRRLALEIELRKKEIESGNSNSTTLLQGLYDLLSQPMSGDKFYATKEIYFQLAHYDLDNFGWLMEEKNFSSRGKWLTKELRIAGVIEGTAVQKKENGETTKGYYLSKEKIVQLLNTQGVDIEGFSAPGERVYTPKEIGASIPF